MNIDTNLVKTLIKEQYPNFSDLKIVEVENSGNDNRTFHLGDSMLVRLPSGKEYASQIEKEMYWLPKLSPYILLDIPLPLFKGNPTKEYPFNWGIYKWIEGETLTYKDILNLDLLAIDLAKFLKELQSIDATLGPKAGKHNFYRGGNLNIYDNETRIALKNLKNIFDTNSLENIWKKCLKSKYTNKPVWIHGDIAVGNLLIKDGRLSAVIDFGILGTGDPACDYVIAWTFFSNKSREIFKSHLNCDEETFERAKGWALWKALISYDIENPNSVISKWAANCINQILK
ncbi:MAG: aminoglycoside phosphotransferase family protein [Cetobacterium sp.]|uniref:aminoglycoside phosphotransferase family protein n=1 Tax=Cetobacterium sp. TaxID=2071632 RepID=UPI003F369959